MNRLVIHHSAGKQFLNSPQEMGGKYPFYSYIVAGDKLFHQHDIMHYRGGLSTLDVCVAGDFTKIQPTQFQVDTLSKLIKDKGLPITIHRNLGQYGATQNTVLPTACPGKLSAYIPTIMNFTVINAPSKVYVEACGGLVSKFTNNQIQCSFTYKQIPTIISADQVIRDEEVIPHVDNSNEFCLIFYKVGVTAPYLTALTKVYDPAKGTICCVIPDPGVPVLNTIFEMGHALRIKNKISIADNYYPDETYVRKYLAESVKQVEPPMTRNEVIALQALEGYIDPAGADFWTGKLLSGYLKARLTDKVKQEQEALVPFES